MSDDPAFNLHDVEELVAAIARYNQAMTELMRSQQSAGTPFCLLIQGASPQTEVDWLEEQFQKPSAEGGRG